MARMIKTTNKVAIGVNLTTMFNDGTEHKRSYKPGDVIQDLRYVVNGEINFVTGKLKTISFEMKSPIDWDPANPANTIPSDMLLKDMNLDASAQYESKKVSVPLKEVVEFDDELANVKRMAYNAFLIVELERKYSDYRVATSSIEVGDVFDNVKIIDPENVGTDITGKFEVVGFAYNVPGKNAINVTGVALKNVDTNKIIVANFENILDMNELYRYEIDDIDAVADVIANIQPGDTVVLGEGLDTSNGKGIVIDGKEDVTLVVSSNITTDGSSTGGVKVTNSKVEISGDGKFVNEHPYGSGYGSGAFRVEQGGEVTFNGGGVSAIVEDDPVNKGQFGLCVFNDGKVTVNDGRFEAGWYCLTGNGSTTNADSAIEINGGTFKSVADYAIYHPDAGKLVINGGKIMGAAGAIAANNGVIEINGGEFVVTGGGDTGEWSDGTSGLGDVALNLNAKYGDIVCRIRGGVFRAAANTIMIATGSAHSVDLQISGGKFSTKPNAEWIAEGYSCSDEKDVAGYYTVTKNA